MIPRSGTQQQRDEMARFWTIPEGMVDWRFEEQEVLFTRMEHFADGYFNDVEKGSVLSSIGLPLRESGMFPFHDRFALYTLVRHFRPKRIIEIGSGDSTKVANLAIRAIAKEQPNYVCKHQCIDPYRFTEIGVSVLPPEIIPKRLEELDPTMFDTLQAGDILFIDSSQYDLLAGPVTLDHI